MPNLIYHGNGNTEGGTTPISYPFSEGAIVTVLNYGTPTAVDVNIWIRLHYHFVSWTSNADGSGVTYAGDSTFVMPSGDVNLYLKWSRYEWGYTLHSGTGHTIVSAVLSGVKQTGVSLSLNWTSYFYKVDYGVTSWTEYEDGSGFSILVPAGNNTCTIPPQTKEIDLYAQWSEILKLTYHSNEGVAEEFIEYYYKGYPSTLYIRSNTYYRYKKLFKSFNTKADASGVYFNPADTFLTGDSNLDLYAIWNPAYVLTLYGSAPYDGVGTPTVIETYLGGVEKQITIPEYRSRGFLSTGYLQIGWGVLEGVSGAIFKPGDIIKVKDSDINLYAIAVSEYSITFNRNFPITTPSNLPSYTTIETIQKYYVIPLTTTYDTTPLSTGYLDSLGTKYLFIDWNSNIDGSGTNYSPGDTLSIFKSNLILYAQWKKIFTFNFYVANVGSTFIYLNVNDVYTFKTYMNLTLSQTNPENNVFIGWNTLEDGTGTSYLEGSTYTVLDDSGLTLYAQWLEGGVVATLNRNASYTDTLERTSIFYKSTFSGGLPGIPPVIVGGTIIVSNTWIGTLSNSSCFFKGWSLNADGSSGIYNNGDSITLTENITIYAQWSYLPFIYYYSSLTVDRGDTPFPVVLQEGSYHAIVRSSNGSSTYTAKFDTPEDAENLLLVVDPPWFQMPSSTLWGIWWYDYDPLFPNDSSKAKFYTSSGFLSALEASANWLLKLRRVPTGKRYVLGESFILSNAVVNSNHTMTRSGATLLDWKLLTLPLPFGHPLVGSDNPIGTPPAYDFTLPNTRVDLYLMAHWNVERQVIYKKTDSTSGTVPVSTSYSTGDIVTIGHSTLFRQHYTFIGWYVTYLGFSAYALKEGDTFIMPEQLGNTIVDLELLPIWVALPRVDYFNNGYPMEVPPFNSYVKDSIVTVTFTGSYFNASTGKEFNGWSTILNDTPTILHPKDTFIMPSTDVELYAVWDTLYTVSFVYSSDDVDTLSVSSGTSIYLPTKLQNKDEFRFSHWQLVDGGSFSETNSITVYSNLVFNAVWEPLDVISTNSLYTVYVKPK